MYIKIIINVWKLSLFLSVNLKFGKWSFECNMCKGIKKHKYSNAGTEDYTCVSKYSYDW